MPPFTGKTGELATLGVLVPWCSSWAPSFHRAFKPLGTHLGGTGGHALSQNSPNPLHLAGDRVLSTGMSFKSCCPPRDKFPGLWSAEPYKDLQPEALPWQCLPGTLLLKCDSPLLITIHATPFSRRDAPRPISRDVNAEYVSDILPALRVNP